MKTYTTFIPTTTAEREKMLHTVGLKSSDELFASIDEKLKIKDGLKLPDGMTELEVARYMQQIAEKNRVFKTVLRGAGAYKHYIPAAVKRITSKEEFVTAYTPYQAEMSQGVLQSIFEYQTMICELTGMEVSNASVYDGATAAAEAVAMCRDRKHNRVLVAGTSNPGVISTIQTYCHGNGMTCDIIPKSNLRIDMDELKKQLADDSLKSDVACVYIAQPNYYGNLEEADSISKLVKEADAKLIMGVNPIALGIMKTPAEYGADIAVGEGQPLGLPLSYGGPYLGFMASTKDMMRKLPGRIVGETTDNEGNRAYVLTLQAREQHIRREKASSNICSNEALCAMTAAVYMAVMGENGIHRAAEQSMSKAHYFAKRLEGIGFKVLNTGDWFHEFVTVNPKGISDDLILGKLEEAGILGGYPIQNNCKKILDSDSFVSDSPQVENGNVQCKNHAIDSGLILWCCTELVTKSDIDTTIEIIESAITCAEKRCL